MDIETRIKITKRSTINSLKLDLVRRAPFIRATLHVILRTYTKVQNAIYAPGTVVLLQLHLLVLYGSKDYTPSNFPNSLRVSGAKGIRYPKYIDVHLTQSMRLLPLWAIYSFAHPAVITSFTVRALTCGNISLSVLVVGRK